MINILIIDLNYTNFGSANIAILHRLFSGQDHVNVTVLTENINSIPEEMVEGFRIIRKAIHSKRSGSAVSLHNAGVYPRLLQAKQYMKKKQDDVDYKRVEDFLYHIEKLIDISEYDLLFSCSSPFESHVCAGRLAEKYHKKWIAYYMDPFSTDSDYPDAHFSNRVRTEEEILQKCDAVLLTNPYMDDYLKHGIKLDLKRAFSVCLPGIRPIVKTEDICWNDRGNVKRSVFIGNFYWSFRDPMNVINCYRELGEPYHLYFIGGVGGDDREKILQEKGLNNIPNVHFMAPVAKEKAEQYMLSADVLVNIGNTVDNLIPSKVFDYLSSGRPVINFYKRDNCTSTAFFRHYPNAGNFDDRCISPSEVKEFLDKTAEMPSLPYDRIREVFPDYSVESVRNAVFSVIETVLEM